MKEFDELVDIISKLRKECPWDKEQTHESLSKHLILNILLTPTVAVAVTSASTASAACHIWTLL